MNFSTKGCQCAILTSPRLDAMWFLSKCSRPALKGTTCYFERWHEQIPCGTCLNWWDKSCPGQAILPPWPLRSEETRETTGQLYREHTKRLTPYATTQGSDYSHFKSKKEVSNLVLHVLKRSTYDLCRLLMSPMKSFFNPNGMGHEHQRVYDMCDFFSSSNRRSQPLSSAAR